MFSHTHTFTHQPKIQHQHISNSRVIFRVDDSPMRKTLRLTCHYLLRESTRPTTQGKLRRETVRGVSCGDRENCYNLFDFPPTLKNPPVCRFVWKLRGSILHPGTYRFHFSCHWFWSNTSSARLLNPLEYLLGRNRQYDTHCLKSVEENFSRTHTQGTPWGGGHTITVVAVVLDFGERNFRYWATPEINKSTDSTNGGPGLYGDPKHKGPFENLPQEYCTTDKQRITHHSTRRRHTKRWQYGASQSVAHHPNLA